VKAAIDTRSLTTDSTVDWELLWTVHANALLVGRHDATDSVMAALRPCLAAPVLVVRPGDLPALPLPRHAGSLILIDVCDFTADEQHRLIEWLDKNDGYTRVISTSFRSTALMLADGQFLKTLYYRLNVITLDVSEQMAHSNGGRAQLA
jgi:Sigma-54 interaction domain